LRRHPDNPILRAADLPGVDQVLVCNPGVAPIDGRYLMAYRADRGVEGDPLLVGTDIGFAWSTDGVSWEPEPAARFRREGAIELLAPLEPHRPLEP
jgi:predicted GH43/DUF377 family glycosyl hydrolase